VTVTTLAGSGSRFLKSLEQRKALAGVSQFDPSWPRGLFPIDNLLPEISAPKVPNALYSFSALKGLAANHIVVVRGFEQEIDRLVLSPLKLSAQSTFVTQQVYPGQNGPSGHGDAVYQAISAWNKPLIQYVVVTFAGDANSFRTLLISLLVFDTLKALQIPIDAVFPVTLKDQATYPIERNKNGFLQALHHNKLRVCESLQSGQADECNIGIWPFCKTVLANTLTGLHESYFNSKDGYSIPGNKTNELAIDNALQSMLGARSETVRALCVGSPEQITPLKDLHQFEDYVQAIRKMVGVDREFRKRVM